MIVAVRYANYSMLFSVSSQLNAYLAHSAEIKTRSLWSLPNLFRVYVARDSGDHFHRRECGWRLFCSTALLWWEDNK